MPALAPLSHTVWFFAALVFVSCNIDGLLLLLVLLCTPSFPTKSVVLGQFLSQFILVLVSVALARLAVHFAPAYIGLAGLLPLSLGFRKLLEQRKSRTEDPHDQMGLPDSLAPSRAVASSTILALSNGGDNLSVYVPIFTVRSPSVVLAMSLVFVVMTAFWCTLAWYLSRHRLIGQLVGRVSQALLPWNMMGLGVYVLSGSLRHALS